MTSSCFLQNTQNKLLICVFSAFKMRFMYFTFRIVVRLAISFHHGACYDGLTRYRFLPLNTHYSRAILGVCSQYTRKPGIQPLLEWPYLLKLNLFQCCFFSLNQVDGPCAFPAGLTSSGWFRSYTQQSGYYWSDEYVGTKILTKAIGVADNMAVGDPLGRSQLEFRAWIGNFRCSSMS